MTPPSVIVDPRLRDLLGELPRDQIHSEQFYASCELIHCYAGEHALGVAIALGVPEALVEPRTLEQIAGALDIPPRLRQAFEWLFERLAEDGLLAVSGAGEGRLWSLRGPLPSPRIAETRDEALALDPANRASLDLYDAAARAWIEVAAGRTTGQAALFGLGQTSLWLAYFANDNPSYSISNRIAAIAAANRLGGRGRLLEVGAGGGSGSACLLGELEDRGRLDAVESYQLTEPSPFFRRRADRELRARFPSIEFTSSALDVDGDWTAQGVALQSVDLVFGVNVFHVAKNLLNALASARQSLAPGGWLVAGEAIRPFEGATLPTELVFRLLDDFNEVELHPRLRPHPGFLSPERWEALLLEVGFEEVGIVPDPRPIREIYPRFHAGAVVGRAPGGS